MKGFGGVQNKLVGGSDGADQFVVGPAGSGAPYETINAAMAAAIVAGFSGVGNDPAYIGVLPGVYAEDILVDTDGFLFQGLAPQLGITGIQAATLVGTVTINIPTGTAADSTGSWDGIEIAPVAGAGIDFAGTSPQSYTFSNFLLTITSSLQYSNDQSSSGLTFQNVSGGGNVGATPVIEFTAASDGTVFFKNGCLIQGQATSLAIQVLAGSGILIDCHDCVFFGAVDVEDGLFSADGCHFRAAGTQSSVDVGAAGAALITNCTIESGNANAFVNAGSLTLGGNSFSNTNIGISGAGTFIDTSLTYVVDATLDWTGADPTTVKEALDRIAAAIGPIA